MTPLKRLRARLAGLRARVRTVASPDYSSRAGTPVTLAVIHTTESPDGSLAGVAEYFRASPVQVSSHYIVGDAVNQTGVWTDVIRCVDERQAAWTARSANRHAVQYELIGRASRTRAQWLGRYRPQLETTAALVAEDCVQYGLPVRRARPGILGHGDLADYGFPNDHTDPGPGFPWPEFLRMVAKYVRLSQPPPPAQKVAVRRPPRPAGAPRRIPRWAWRLDAWLSTAPADRGPRPAAAPQPLPGWFHPWRAWLHGLAAPLDRKGTPS